MRKYGSRSTRSSPIAWTGFLDRVHLSDPRELRVAHSLLLALCHKLLPRPSGLFLLLWLLLFAPLASYPPAWSRSSLPFLPLIWVEEASNSFFSLSLKVWRKRLGHTLVCALAIYPFVCFIVFITVFFGGVGIGIYFAYPSFLKCECSALKEKSIRHSSFVNNVPKEKKEKKKRCPANRLLWMFCWRGKCFSREKCCAKEKNITLQEKKCCRNEIWKEKWKIVVVAWWTNKAC